MRYDSAFIVTMNDYVSVNGTTPDVAILAVFSEQEEALAFARQHAVKPNAWCQAGDYEIEVISLLPNGGYGKTVRISCDSAPC